jgi:hypothetical protein
MNRGSTLKAIENSQQKAGYKSIEGMRESLKKYMSVKSPLIQQIISMRFGIDPYTNFYSVDDLANDKNLIDIPLGKIKKILKDALDKITIKEE